MSLTYTIDSSCKYYYYYYYYVVKKLYLTFNELCIARLVLL